MEKGWEKCPACDGVGWTGVGFPTGDACTVCAGQKIISVATGRPPYEIVSSRTILLPMPKVRKCGRYGGEYNSRS
jgi:hypothetical protein